MYIVELLADAGEDENLSSTETSVQLDGTASTGDITSWNWELTR